jgi:hypothetical protein
MFHSIEPGFGPGQIVELVKAEALGVEKADQVIHPELGWGVANVGCIWKLLAGEGGGYCET